MKDSTMILMVAAVLAAAAIPGLGTAMSRVARATETIEQVRVAAHAPSGMRTMVSRSHGVRLHSTTKGWWSL